MRIISQRGKGSVDEYGCYIYINERNEIIGDIGHTVALLGSYKTIERAKEVFDELHAAYEELPLETIFSACQRNNTDMYPVCYACL